MTQSGRLDAGVTNASATARDDRDIFRLAPSMDATVLETIAARLEFRGTDEGYARRSQAYLPRLPLAHARRILALGCGTGIEVRALRRLTRPDTAIIGVDHSPALIDAARRLTAEDGCPATSPTRSASLGVQTCFPRHWSTTGEPSRPKRPSTTPSSGRPTTTPT